MIKRARQLTEINCANAFIHFDLSSRPSYRQRAIIPIRAQQKKQQRQ
jgi:hypothetical protein|eukprot:COSAG06_NODE_716_length_12859_cov_5.127900_6_plen_47_part_00